MAADPARITARILIETESVLFRPEDPFVLTSGLTSPVYIDCRRLISFPRARGKLMDMGAALIEEAIGFESIDIVADRVKAAVENDNEPLTAVLIGADELWEVSLLKFVVDYIQRSAPSNLQDLTQRAHGEASESNPKISIHDEIEADFATARIDPRRVNELGNKLQRYGLFETYEDRFYALMPG